MKFTRKVRLDRIGSATHPAKLGPIAEVSPEVVLEEGAVVAARALGERKVYGEIELPTGRLAKVVTGNILAGVLGARQALHGYMGDLPKSLKVGDVVHLLNIGGVIGECTSPNAAMGPPIPVEILGSVVRNGQPINIRDFALPACDRLTPEGPPLVIVMGTCMSSGKTFAASELIRVLAHLGVKIASGKLSGVAAIKDLLSMSDNGAIATASFIDCGLPSTVRTKDLAPIARAVISHLEKSQPEMIVLELGDGIIGGYNVRSILEDESVRLRTKARVLCANDLVGAWGGLQFLEKLGHRPDVFSGPVTDNAVGTSYITRELGAPATNARNEPIALARAVAKAMNLKLEVRG